MTDPGSEDHRTRRWKLPPSAFVIAPEVEPDPIDLIDKDTWTELTWLPDDVSLRTTDHHGSTFRQAIEFQGYWVSLTLDLQSLLADPREDALALGCLAAADEFQASSYGALTGFYRQAISTLRPALEGIVAGAYFRAFPDPSGFHAWADGLREGKLWWQRMRKDLATVEPHAQFANNEGFLSDGGLLSFLYDRLSAFSHSRPFYTDEDGRRIPTTNVGLWGMSNGPVYEPRSVHLWSVYFFSVALSCVLVVGLSEPRLLSIARPTALAYREMLNRTVTWQVAEHPSIRPVLQHLMG